MELRSKTSSREKRPRARTLKNINKEMLLGCGIDPAALPIILPKTRHLNLLIEDVKLYAANILKQTMLSIGGDVAIHRGVINGKKPLSSCIITGDLRHFKKLEERLRQQPGLASMADTIRQQIHPGENHLDLDLCSHHYHWEATPLIMGILNATPDSFSDGGLWNDLDKAVDHCMEMVEQGAQIIDIGGESSRPGSREVDRETEVSRVIPLIEKLAARIDVPISIDTKKADVARMAIDAGAGMVNDISALRDDPDMMEVIADTGSGICLMHMRGTPKTMQKNTGYDDIITEVYNFLDERVNTCVQAGVSPSSIIIDPGIGFGKDLKGNLGLIGRMQEFKSLGMPLLVGHSRKSFIGQTLDTQVNDRDEGTDAVTAWSVMEGADIIRVHDITHAQRTRSVIRSIMEEA